MTTDALWERLRVLEQETAQVLQALREAGEPVRRQRVRIRPDNPKLALALETLQSAGAACLTRQGLAKTLNIGPDYAFDLLDALRAAGRAEKVRRGVYRAKDYHPFIH